MNTTNIHDIIGKDHYVLLDVFGEGCIHCYHMVDTMNKLKETFDKTRPDIKIYKMNARENPTISRQFRIQYYPTLLFFRPGETEFPYPMVGKHEYEQVLRMTQSFKKQESVRDMMTQEEIDKMCKTEVKQALAVYERELREESLLLTKDKLKYYQNLEERIHKLGEKDQEVKKELGKIENLEKEAKESEKIQLKSIKIIGEKSCTRLKRDLLRF